MKLTYSGPLRGEISVPGDKSISHRAVMFGALANGTTEITHFLQGADCLSTIDCFRRMGIDIENTPSRILIHGKGLRGLSAPSSALDVGNSGTTLRLISGILSGQDFKVLLDGDASIRRRPMKRIMTPLSMMGAKIGSLKGNGCAPLHIKGQALHAIHYQSPVASVRSNPAFFWPACTLTARPGSQNLLCPGTTRNLCCTFWSPGSLRGNHRLHSALPRPGGTVYSGARRHFFSGLLYRRRPSDSRIGSPDPKRGRQSHPRRHPASLSGHGSGYYASERKKRQRRTHR